MSSKMIIEILSLYEKRWHAPLKVNTDSCNLNGWECMIKNKVYLKKRDADVNWMMKKQFCIEMNDVVQ